MDSRTVQFLKSYLNCLGVVGYTVNTSDEGADFLITVEIPEWRYAQKNVKNIGYLKGKQGRNLLLLKRLLRVIGLTEGRNPFLIIKLEENDTV